MKKAGVAVVIFLVVAGVAVTILCLVIPDLPGKLSAGLRGDSGEPLSGGKPASHWLNELRDPDAGIRQEAAYNLKLLLADERHREALAPKAARTDLQTKFGLCEAQPPADDPEWYFRVRDFLFRLP